MRSTLLALLALVSSAAFAAPSLTSPDTAATGSTIAIKAVGNGDPRDFVTVVPKGAREGSYQGYVYVKPGELKLVMPAAPGDYELRLCEANSPYKTLAMRPIKLTSASASVSAPATVAAGSTFEVKWTGPNNERDYVTIGETTPGGRLYLDYKYSREGSPVKLSAPEKPGNYEVRYILGVGDTVIARQPITVGGVTASVTASRPGRGRREIQSELDRPEQPARLRHHGQGRRTPRRPMSATRTRTRARRSSSIAPDEPGNYELRYATGNGIPHAGARADHRRCRSPARSPAPHRRWPARPSRCRGKARTMRAISSPSCRRARARARTAGSYFYTTPQNNPGNLVAPLAPGEYELRYSTAEKYLTLARAAIQIMPAKNEPGKITAALAAGTKASGAIEIILDASGSMLQKLGGERRIDIAKKTLTKLTSSTIPAGTPFAFRVFGREVDSCQTDLDVPVGPLNPAAVAQRIAALVAKNGAKTPIGASLDKVADDLKSVTGEKLIVLVTDGEETCGGDPAASIERLRKAGIGTRVSIVGFALDDEKLATTFRRWSDAGGGAFFDAKDAAGLDKSLTEALRPGFEVVNAQGQVIASGLVGGDAVQVPAGNHTVRIKGRANASKPVVVKPKETANVEL